VETQKNRNMKTFSKCISCSKKLDGQRWRFCSDSCNNRIQSEKNKKIIRAKELDNFRVYYRLERIRLNSSKESYDLIKGMLI
jgi:predicted nucleic acid-binding Zn ribbon protein